MFDKLAVQELRANLPVVSLLPCAVNPVLRILMGDNCGPRGSTPTGCLVWVGKTREWVVVRVYEALRLIFSFQPTALGSG